MKRLENTLRLKVTGKCNRSCFFCHQEGGMHQIDQLEYSDSLKILIHRLYLDFNIRSIALTGGEPLLHDNLQAFILAIRNNTPITNFALTTNGSIYRNKDYWYRMKELGTYKVNISIPDILTSIDAVGSENRISVFENQMNTIEILNEIGISPNVNVVAYNDLKYLTNLLTILFSQNMQFNIALLPDLTNTNSFLYSQKTIADVLSAFHCHKKGLRFRQGTSNAVYEYVTSTGKALHVKTTKKSGEPERLSSICQKCEQKKQCQEGFYGIRAESSGGILMVRLCLYKSNPEVLMPVEDFLESSVYEELRNIWN